MRPNKSAHPMPGSHARVETMPLARHGWPQRSAARLGFALTQETNTA